MIPYWLSSLILTYLTPFLVFLGIRYILEILETWSDDDGDNI